MTSLTENALILEEKFKRENRLFAEYDEAGGHILRQKAF